MNILEACILGDFPNIQKLVISGANINEQFEMGATALMVAVQEGNIDIVLYLLEHGANPNLKAHEGVSPLMIAAAKGNTAIAKLLVEHGAETAYSHKK